jgi:single-stranded DNA-binding protein
MASRQKSEGSLDPVFVLDVLKTQQFQAVVEPGLGNGYSVWVGQGEKQVGVGVFPEAKAVQVVSGTSILRLDNVHLVKRRGQQLHLEAMEEHENVSVDIGSDGAVVLRRRPRLAEHDDEGAQASGEEEVPFAVTAAPPAQEAPKVRRPRKQPTQDQPQKREDTRQDSQPETTAMVPATTENERRTIRGRVGNEIRFRTTARRNMLVASFPLGEHPDLETTIWHTIVVFGDRAQKLKEKGLTRGQEIEVVGYVHEREGKNQAGEPKKIQEIYATAIRTTLRKLTDNS